VERGDGRGGGRGEELGEDAALEAEAEHGGAVAPAAREWGTVASGAELLPRRFPWSGFFFFFANTWSGSTRVDPTRQSHTHSIYFHVRLVEEIWCTSGASAF
jgi:hypothetical protein